MKSNYLEVIIEYKDIKSKIKTLAKKLIKELKEDPKIVFVNVLNGTTPFFVDLIREINLLGYNNKINIQYISCSSYQNINSTELKINKWLDMDQIKNKKIYIFEDVIDTGKTLTKIIKTLYKQEANEIKIFTLTDKYEMHKNFKYKYEALFVVKNIFLVGYGLDCDEKFRQLRDICIYKN